MEIFMKIEIKKSERVFRNCPNGKKINAATLKYMLK